MKCFNYWYPAYQHGQATVQPSAEIYRLLATSFVKSQQWVLQRKHGETAHQGDYAIVGPMVHNLGKILVNRIQYGVDIEMFADGYLGIGDNLFY